MSIQKTVKAFLTATLTLGLLLTTAGLGATAAYANDANAYKRQIFSETNSYRTANGKSNIYASAYLDKLAQDWADSLARTGEYKHNPNLSSTVFSQPGWTAVAENLVAQRPDGNAAMQAWKDSAGHRANLLGNYDRIGIGVSFGGPYGTYYVQVFGTNPSSASTDLYGAPLLPKPKPTTPPKQDPPKPPKQDPPAPPKQDPPKPAQPKETPKTTAPPKQETQPQQPAEKKEAVKTETSKKEETAEKKDEKKEEEKAEAAEKEAQKQTTTTTAAEDALTEEQTETVTTPHSEEEPAVEAEIKRITDNPEIFIKDLQTRSGTYVQANLNSPTELAKNASILGGTLILFAVAAQLMNRHRVRKLQK